MHFKIVFLLCWNKIVFRHLNLKFEVHLAFWPQTQNFKFWFCGNKLYELNFKYLLIKASNFVAVGIHHLLLCNGGNVLSPAENCLTVINCINWPTKARRRFTSKLKNKWNGCIFSKHHYSEGISHLRCRKILRIVSIKM